MSQRLHYLITFITMLFLGVIIAKPQFLISLDSEGRQECRTLMERASCHE